MQMGMRPYQKLGFLFVRRQAEPTSRMSPRTEGTHQSFVGASDTNGEYLSAQSATYPDKLADAIAARLKEVLSHNILQMSLPWSRVHCSMYPLQIRPPRRQTVIQAETKLDNHEVYIGWGNTPLQRRTWHNPFTINRVGRDQCIELYTKERLTTLELHCALPDLADAELACHCRLDQECHGEVILAQSERQQKRLNEGLVARPTSPHPDPKCRVPDGGGRHSTGNWRAPQPNAQDVMQGMRSRRLELACKHDLHRKLLAPVEQQSATPLFRGAWEQAARTIVAEEMGCTFDRANVVAPDQPFHLELIETIAKLIRDPESGLPGALSDGVPLGCTEPIEYSGIFSQRKRGSRCSASWVHGVRLQLGTSGSGPRHHSQVGPRRRRRRVRI